MANRFIFRDHDLAATSMLQDLSSTGGSYNTLSGETLVQRYKPWGEVRPGPGNSLPTKYTYTRQYSNTDDFGLMFYNARWYDPALGRFAQADTVVPGGAQGLDRYAYVRNSPVMYTDPSGHAINCDNLPAGHREGCERAKESLNQSTEQDGNEIPPAGLTADGLIAWGRIQDLKKYAKEMYGIKLTSQDLLAWIILIEYMSTYGSLQEYNQTIAKKYHTWCSDGPYSASCINNFWGYMQVLIRSSEEDMYLKFDTWFGKQTDPDTQAYIDYWLNKAREVAHAIQNPNEPNDYGIDASACNTGDFCDWGSVSKGSDPIGGYDWVEINGMCGSPGKPGKNDPNTINCGIHGSVQIWGYFSEGNWTYAFIYIK